MVIRTPKKPDKATSMFWSFLYAIGFVATFGGLVFTLLSLVTGIWNKDRRIIDLGLKLLLFTAIAGMVFYLMLLRLGGIFAEKIKEILDSL
jgi:hypothetical protein